MNQNDFRALLASSSSRGGGNDGGAYGGKRNMTEADLNEIWRLSKKPKAKGKKKKKEQPSDETRKSTDATGYRDRAAERRQGLHTDMISADEYAHFDAEQTKFLGGDMEHTHLVKGLDFALLAQLKREKEKLLQATQQAKTSSTARLEVQAAQQQSAEKPITFKSRMGRLVYFHAVQSTTMSTMLQQSGAQRKSEHFLPGRMYYAFNLASTELESVPTIVQRSKDDCPSVDELVSGIVDELVISKVGDALNSSKRLGTKKLRKKEKTKDDGDDVDNHEGLNEDENSTAVKASNSGAGGAAVDDDDDEDIFPDVGEYVPIDQRDEKEERRSTVVGASSGYFSNLSASINAAEQAEQKREAEAEHAWKQTIRKVAETQSNAERERREQERKQKEARAGLQVDEYSECYPEYQAAAALDSEDDEEAPRKGADRDMDDEMKDGEKQRRKKQKQGNKLQNDLEKINKRSRHETPICVVCWQLVSRGSRRQPAAALVAAARSYLSGVPGTNQLLHKGAFFAVHEERLSCGRRCGREGGREAGGIYAARSAERGSKRRSATCAVCRRMADEIALARERLAAKFGGVRTGGKGSVRRKYKAPHKVAAADDKKLDAVLKKLGTTPIPAVEEVNLFKADGQVIHFVAPKVQAAIAANTFAVTGHSSTKSLQELLPGIINQLGPDNLANLKQIAESYTAAQKAARAAAGEAEDDDDVPDLVDNFEDVSQQD
ncbi:Transmembrane protein, partial [Globisporangium splendens]